MRTPTQTHTRTLTHTVAKLLVRATVFFSPAQCSVFLLGALGAPAWKSQHLQNVSQVLPNVQNILPKQVSLLLAFNYSTVSSCTAALPVRGMPTQADEGVFFFLFSLLPLLFLFVPNVNYKQSGRLVGLLKVSVCPGNTLPFCTPL